MAFLTKKTLMIGGSIIASIATVIAIAVPLSLKNQAVLEKNNNQISSNQGDKEVINKTAIDTFLEQIDSSNVVIKNLDETNKATEPFLVKSQLHAFNVIQDQIELSDQITIPSNIKVKFDIEQLNNNASLLNQGKLNVLVTAINNELNETKTKVVELNDFKKAASESEFTNLVTKKEDKLVFNIELATGKENKFVNLEVLNHQGLRVIQNEDEDEIDDETVETVKETGLSYWWNEVSEMNETNKSIKLDGQVRLAEIAKDNEKTHFYLSAKDSKNWIKLIKTNNQKTQEIAVDLIKTRNILASSVVIKPTQKNKQKNEEFVNALKDINGQEKYLLEDTNKSLDKTLAVDLNKQNSSSTSTTARSVKNLLFINPSLVQKKQEQQTTLPIAIEVKFGRDDYLKTYSTSNEKDLNVLKDNGFKFGIFSKKLTKYKDKQIKPEFFTTTKKAELTKYFISANYIEPKQRIEKQPQDADKYPGGFNLEEIGNNALKTDLTIKLIDKDADTKNSKNWLLFADYSYLGIEMNKVLMTDLINLIHFEAYSPIN